MTINVEALIQSLGKTYEEIYNNGLIPYKTKPKGFSGDEDISLDMAKEGVYLSFHRKDRILTEISLTLINEKKIDWVFSNELPLGLTQLMTRSWIHQQFGDPVISSPPKMVMRRQFGWKEVYSVPNYHVSVSMIVSYDLQENVNLITFLPTSEGRW